MITICSGRANEKAKKKKGIAEQSTERSLAEKGQPLSQRPERRAMKEIVSNCVQKICSKLFQHLNDSCGTH